VSDQHPTVPSWTPEPPPPARSRGLGGGLVAALIAVVLLFGGVGLYAARRMTATAQGGASPETAAAGLLTALGSQDLDRAGGYLDAEERLLLATYRDRATALLAGRMTGPTGQPLSGLQLTARDIRFQRVAGLGGDDVAVVELAGGTVGGRDARGAKLELPVSELNRRLAEQSKGAVKALRMVAVRSGDDWQVSLLASAAEHARLAAGAAEPDWNTLTGAGPRAAPGAASPKAAVRDLVTAAGGGQQAALERLSPAERRVLAAYRPLLDHKGGMPATGGRVDGLQTRTEQVAGDVARVRATAGQVRLADGMPGQRTLDLGQATAHDQAPYVVTIRQDGTWYPSLVFTVTDWMLTRAERERP
jgi:hypothetical protein